MAKVTTVRGLVDCAGDGFTLNVGQVLDLPAGIAESLILGGLAEPFVEAVEAPPPDDAAQAKAADAAAEVLAQQERAPRKRSAKGS